MSEEMKKDDVIAEEVIVEETTEEVVAEEATTIEAPLTSSRTISAINASLQEMSKEDLDAIYEAAKKTEDSKTKVEADDDDDDEEGDEDEGEVETEKKEAKTKKEDTFKEDVDALVNGEESLSEGFKDKAAIIFEAALQTKVAAKTVELEERYSSDLSEEVEAIKEDLVDKVDGYLNYVVENWMKENEVAIQHGLKSEITESFIDAMHGVFTEHYISIPEDKVEIVDALTEEVTDTKDQLNTATETNMELTEKVKAFERKEIVAEACEGLAVTESVKIKELAEAVEADTNDEFAKKVATIKESYLNKNDTSVESEDEIDAITEEKEETSIVTGPMAAYLDAIKKSN